MSGRNSKTNTEKDWQRFLDAAKASRRLLKERIRDNSVLAKLNKGYYESACEAQKNLQNIAQGMQSVAAGRISAIVSKCLSAVFAEDYEFHIEFVQARGRTEAKFWYKVDGKEQDPKTDSGGIMDVAALALRLAQLVLSFPQPRKLLLLDEPFHWVDGDNIQKVAEMIHMMAKEMDVQFVIVTHEEDLEIGKVIRL